MKSKDNLKEVQEQNSGCSEAEESVTNEEKRNECKVLGINGERNLRYVLHCAFTYLI